MQAGAFIFLKKIFKEFAVSGHRCEIFGIAVKKYGKTGKMWYNQFMIF